MSRFLGGIVAVALLMSVTGSATADMGKIDLMLHGITATPNLSTGKALFGKAVKSSADGVALIDLLMKVSSVEKARAEVLNLGGIVRTVAGDILSVSIPLTTLEYLSEFDFITYIEAPREIRMRMNTAREHTRVAAAQSGATTGTGLTGRNVVVGVIDGSLDYSHDNFRAPNGTTRVRYVKQVQYDQQGNQSNVLTCIKEDIDAGRCQIEDQGQREIHGTHVTGIAASSDATYRGAAPGADIMFVFFAPPSFETNDRTLNTFSGAICDAGNEIFQLADRLDLPAVVNMSLGTGFGARDDTSLMEQCLNNLILDASGNERPGRVFVSAAGNENDSAGQGYGGIHASVNVPALASHSFVWREFDTRSLALGSPSVVEIWLTQSTGCSAKVYALREFLNNNTPPQPSLEFVNLNGQFSVPRVRLDRDSSPNDAANQSTTSDGALILSIGADAQDPNNGKAHGQVMIVASEQLSNNVQTQEQLNQVAEYLAPNYFAVVLEAEAGGSCVGNMWLAPDFTSIHSFGAQGLLNELATRVVSVFPADSNSETRNMPGDSRMVITMPGTASSVITVASTLQEKPLGSGESRFTDVDGAIQHQNRERSRDQQGNFTGTYDPPFLRPGMTSRFSSRGPVADRAGGTRAKPDIAAPGEPIISTLARSAAGEQNRMTIVQGGGYVKLEGTSMATPHVTGAIALLLEHNNTLTASQIKDFLRRTAVPVPSATQDDVGAGLINLEAALRAVPANTSAYAGQGVITAEDARRLATGESGAAPAGPGAAAPAGGGGASGGGGGCSLIPIASSS